MTLPRDGTTDIFQDGRSLPFTLPAISATVTLGLTTVDRTFRVKRVEIVVDSTYTADPANFYAFTLIHGGGSTVAASFSTQTSAQGAITAGVPVTMVLNATDASRVCAALDTLSLVATKNGTAANITPRIVLHGTYVQ